MNIITGESLARLSIDEMEKLYKNMRFITQEQKELAWKKMDTGIYDELGNLIGDRFLEEDEYSE